MRTRDYMADLVRWEGVIKKKDAAVSSRKCVAEAMAIISPILITSAKFALGLIRLHDTKLIKIIVCIVIIHPLL